ncbi:MAG: GEVED domain-containing protein [Bacteroidota bacterium]
MKTFLLALCCYFLLGAFLPLSAQLQKDHVPGEMIVMLEPGTDLNQFMRKSWSVEGKWHRMTHKQTLARTLRIHLLAFDSALDEATLLRLVRNAPEVVLAQHNHYVMQRTAMTTVPSDPQFNQQWDMDNTGQNGGTVDADIDAPEAWDISTGGISALGDTIVVAVIDGGADVDHPDLSLWKNHDEIPNNGIDDDNNGYVDDYDGWNAYNSTGNVLADGHGTHVSGTVAAKGDNGIGVTGVNWDAQVMPISGSSGQEATVVAAYAYALEARMEYDATNGTAGAFVVATNSSFGVDFANPINYPIWCAMYDSLGAAGILSAAATMNNNSDVDQTGDVPTACPSDWMISVTNTNRFDNKNFGAAFGLTSIDLGAPGTQILSSLPNNSYGNLTGTSMATPHVAGAVALILSSACPGFMLQYKSNPAAMSIEVRDYLLAGVDSVPDLIGATVTGGRLNVYNSLLLLQSECGFYSECAPVNDVSFGAITDSSSLMNWTSVDSATQYEIRYQLDGDSVWTYAGIVSNPQYFLDGLDGCSLYDVQVGTICGTDTSGFFDFLTFSVETEGCCEYPEGIDLMVSTDSTSSLNWGSVYGATAYEIRYRVLGDSVWTLQWANDTTDLLAELQACTAYEAQISTICDKDQFGFSPSIFFSTNGCGICIEGPYCDPRPGSSNLAHISNIAIGTYQNASGDDGGYGVYYEADEEMLIGQAYPIALIPGFSVTGPQVLWRAWLDVNQDGDFDDPNEKMFESDLSTNPATGILDLPADLPLGRTRLRIGMKLTSVAGDFPAACDSFPYGEIEDYCLKLNVPCEPINDLTVQKRYDGSELLDLNWSDLHPDVTYLLAYRPIGGTWTEMQLDTNSAILGPLMTCEAYEFRVQPICLSDTGNIGSVPVVRTLGCGFCQDEPYCDSKGDATNDWIESVEIAGFQNQSSSDQGYGDYTGAGPVWAKGSTASIELTPGGNDPTQSYLWEIWADLDQDGAFAAAEVIYQSSQAIAGAIQADVTLPISATNGTTRLRIQMKQSGNSGGCETISSGEVEDYCLNIQPPVSVEDAWEQFIQVYPNPARDQVSIEADNPLKEVVLWDLQGLMVQRVQEIGTESVELSLEQMAAGMYQLEIITLKGRAVRKLLVE